MTTKLICLFAVLELASPAAFGQRAGMPVYDPNDPPNARSVVRRDERERLGLNERDWTGVVHPNVPQAFERLKILPKDPMERVTFITCQRFRGTVYVQVHLERAPVSKPHSDENKAEIAAAQHRVLGSLTAAEFHLTQSFEASPGLVGFATKEGVDKLATHQDVAGVCLDDKPFPEEVPMLAKNDLPAIPNGGNPGPPSVSIPKVQSEVFQSYAIQNPVFVIVAMEPTSDPIPRLTEERSEFESRWEAREAAVRRLQDRVLSVVTAEEFRLQSRFGGSKAVTGFATLEGLKKLAKHEEVTEIFLDERIPRPTMPIRRR